MGYDGQLTAMKYMFSAFTTMHSGGASLLGRRHILIAISPASLPLFLRVKFPREKIGLGRRRWAKKKKKKKEKKTALGIESL